MQGTHGWNEVHGEDWELVETWRILILELIWNIFVHERSWKCCFGQWRGSLIQIFMVFEAWTRWITCTTTRNWLRCGLLVIFWSINFCTPQKDGTFFNPGGKASCIPSCEYLNTFPSFSGLLYCRAAENGFQFFFGAKLQDLCFKIGQSPKPSAIHSRLTV